MAQLYQNGFGYLSGSGTPSTGSFVINNAQWNLATSIAIHDVPFDNFGPGGITGSDNANFSSYYSNLGPGSVIFLNYSESVWSYDVTSISDSTGYTTFTVTNLTGPAISPTPGIRPIIFNILPAGAGATISNDANNRILTATGTQGSINAEANLTFDGSTLNVTGGITATIGTGTDNSVVVKNASNQLVTDEIDARVWGSTLVDGSGTATYVAYWSDANSITGESTFVYNAATNTLTVSNLGAVSMAGDLTFAGYNLSGGSTGNITETDTITCTTLNAGEKNFDIPHPSKPGWRLRYSVLEGPERGIYVRGKITQENTITLPEYWKDLIYEDSISVQLTPIGKSCSHYVSSVSPEQVTIACECGEVNAYYTVFAERKYYDPLITEYNPSK